MTGPLVSVITPCLNARDWLERCLDNVARQTYPLIEHLVVDGGSTDGAVELLESRGVRFISEPDSGQANAINKGFRLASGDVLGWLNADDLFVSDAVESVVDALRREPTAGWSYGRSRVERAGSPVVALTPPRRLSKRTLDSGNLLTQPGFFMTRWALEQVGELDESFHLGMDYDLWLRLVDAGIPAVYIPRTLAIYEVHQGSKTGTVDPSEFVREWAEALFKSGRTREAAFAFGRAAAASAAEARKSLSRTEITSLADRVVQDQHGHGRTLDPRAVEAGASVEAAVIEVHRSPAGLRHLLQPSVWRYPQTRARLILASRFLARSLMLRAGSVVS
jgi:glycosyltransferase involved in cell wall biosynthesis